MNIYCSCALLVTLVAAACLQLTDAQRTTADGCWNIYDGLQVKCAGAYRQVRTANLDLCAAVCAADRPRCTAADYDYGGGNDARNGGVCKLYQGGMPSVTGGRPPRGGPGRGGHRSGSGSRSREQHRRPGPGGPRGRGKRQARHFGGGGGGWHGGGRPGGGRPGGGRPSQCDFNRGAQMERCSGVAHLRPNSNCLTISTQATRATQPPTTSTRRPTTTTIFFPSGTTCPSGTDARFVVYENTRWVDATATPVTGVTLTECVEICASNRLPNGQSIACRSVSYAFSACAVSARAPDDAAQLEAADGSTFYEKICIDGASGAGGRCVGPYFVAPQFMLIGVAAQVSTVDDRRACLQECLDAERLYGFVCNSGMFFGGGVDNCILNEQTRDDLPDLFQPVGIDDERVEYFETNCPGNLAQKSASTLRRRQPPSILSSSDEWASWSPCASGEQRRYRGCPTTGQPWLCEHETRKCERRSGGAACDMAVQCCALRHANGEKDCAYGMRIGVNTLQREKCTPSDC